MRSPTQYQGQQRPHGQVQRGNAANVHVQYSKRAKWRSEKGAGELIGVHQIIHSAQKKNPGGNRFLGGGRRASRRGGPRWCHGYFFMTLQPTQEYKQNLRQPVGSLSPTSSNMLEVVTATRPPRWRGCRCKATAAPSYWLRLGGGCGRPRHGTSTVGRACKRKYRQSPP